MQLFYTPDINGPIYTLNEEESKHIARVLRIKQGGTLHLTDGKGNLHIAQVTDNNPKHCVVEVTETIARFEQRPYYLHIAVAPTKNIDRFEWFVEKATEIGIDEITPLYCEHSERKVVKQERTEKVAVAAIKQSLKAYLPIINEGIKFTDFIKQPFDGKKCIAHCEKSEKTPFQKATGKKERVLILIGPEGDFSPNEIKLAQQYGFTEVSLGNSRLRTETAAVVACHTVALLNELV